VPDRVGRRRPALRKNTKENPMPPSLPVSPFQAGRYRRLLWLALPLALAACQTTPPPPQPAPLPQPPSASHQFEFDPDHDDVVGELQVTRASAEDTLSDIARRFNLGYDELVRANPGVDPWLPREGTAVVLPTRFVLPQAPRKGIVINLAAQRLYYFPPRQAGEPQTVITHPIGIGRVGWATPLGTTKVTAKAADPWWYPPISVRREHAAEGDPLPAKVPPGPDNPLGRYKLTLGWPSYLIHGTNNPYGVGMRTSHGCIRMYPEDIAGLFDAIPVGTPVAVVNQPLVYGWQGESLYLQSFPALEDDKRKHAGREHTLLEAAIADARQRQQADPAVDSPSVESPAVDSALVTALAADPRGLALPVSNPQLTVEQYLAAVPQVDNRLPDRATWDGMD
jgi:L,D-transpeptidase ErfK/SrfK